MPFGGVCVLLFGDPLQLKPVLGRYPWQEPKDPKHMKAHMLSSTWELFQPVMLRTNHRQGKDLEYSKILERIRVGEVEVDDMEELGKRVVEKNDPKIDDSSVFIFSQNVPANEKNAEVMQRLDGIEYCVKAKVRHHVLREYTPKIEKTGNIENTALQETLRFKVGSRVMLTYNENTSDRLTNGAFGKVVGVDMNRDAEIMKIYVEFDNKAIGKETAKDYEDLKKKFGVQTIPIKKREQEYNIGRLDNAGSKATATQFPLKLCTACTCHKVERFVVNLTKTNIFCFRCRVKPSPILLQLLWIFGEPRTRQ